MTYDPYSHPPRTFCGTVTKRGIVKQEFADARRTIGQAPAVTFSQKEPPLELKNVKGVKAGDNNGFVSFGKYTT